MLPHRPSQMRLAALSERLSDAGGAGLWIVGIVAASLLVWWAGGRVAAVAVGIAGMVLAAWRLVKSLRQLRGALRDAERRLATAEAAVRQSERMASLGRLTVGVAHDFNNDLTVISNNVELLAGRLNAGQAQLLRHAEAAMQGVRRAAVLTGRLLALSRPTSVEPEPVDVDRLVSGLSELLRRTLRDQISLEVRLSGSPWLVWTDATQMESVLLSLVTAACNDVPDEGTLRIAVSNVQLDTEFVRADPTMRPGEHVQVTVNASTAAASEGSKAADMAGGSLSTVQAFLQDAGGCLRSDGDHSLRIFLPRYVPPSITRIRPSHDARGQMTVLVVEDEAAVRSVCVETLEGLGYRVLQAPDAMEAFRLVADEGGIDLLFTDLGLPGGVSGQELADAARNVDPGMRVLFTTGYENTAPPRPLLRKPFNQAQLAEKVAAVLATERQGRSKTCKAGV